MIFVFNWNLECMAKYMTTVYVSFLLESSRTHFLGLPSPFQSGINYMNKECTVKILPFKKLVFSTRIPTGMQASLFFQGEQQKNMSQKVEEFHIFVDLPAPPSPPHKVSSDITLWKMQVCLHPIFHFSLGCCIQDQKLENLERFKGNLLNFLMSPKVFF